MRSRTSRSAYGPAQWLAGMAVALVAALAGCGTRDQVRLVPATGLVTLNNEPVPDVSVVFEPASLSTGKLATGRTNTRGEFALYTDNRAGAACGRYKAAVMSSGAHSSAADAGSAVIRSRDRSAGSVSTDQSQTLIPERYINPEASGLAFEVVKNGPNQFLIRLVNR